MSANANHTDVPEGFTLSLAPVDAIPAALFCASAAVFGARLGSPLFAGHRDQGSARDNWTEQLTNTAGQACPLAALLLA